MFITCINVDFLKINRSFVVNVDSLVVDNWFDSGFMDVVCHIVADNRMPNWFECFFVNVVRLDGGKTRNWLDIKRSDQKMRNCFINSVYVNTVLLLGYYSTA